MKKLIMQTPDITEENISKIAELFPNVITEKEGADGATVKAIDFELLKQVLSKDLVDDGNERYRLDWPGKKASLLKANTPVTSTLRPDRESSVNFDTTENIFIEGDNFEVLKVLQESYLGKIKMIYIDPPYNTGKDFIYRDNFTQAKDEYDEETEVLDEEGNKMYRNTETNGRFHSDWLSMMYERLVLARDLLTDDGVIFISIDDNEVANLRKIGDEIFGEENFVANFIRKTKSTTNDAGVGVNIQHENCLSYSKTISNLVLRGEYKTFETYSNPDNDLRGEWTASDPTATDDGRKTKNTMEIINVVTGKVDIPGTGRRWRFNEEGFKKLVEENRLIFKKKHSTNERGFILKRYKNELTDDRNLVPTLLTENIYLNQAASKELNELLEGKFFDYPKPVSFISDIVKYTTNQNSIILDFFAGSGTTAHAVMEINAEDDGNRKFVMVQLNEKIDENSEAYKAGYKYISEISKERIRRAGKKILEENTDSIALREKPLDIGFRAYKTDTTNMKDVYYHPSQVVQEDLFNLVSNIKEDRTSEDLLTQVILDLGLTLDLPIEKKELRGNAVYFVAGNALVACFDEKIDFGIVDDIAKYEPLKVVFKDASFKEEQDRTNLETRFKRLSPDTIITVL